MNNISVIQFYTWYQSNIDHWSNCKALKWLNLSWWNSNLQQCFLGVEVEMSFNGLRLGYVLEGRLNYIARKDRMEVVLDDNGLKEFIDAEVPKPTSSDAAILDAWQKKTAKC